MFKMFKMFKWLYSCAYTEKLNFSLDYDGLQNIVLINVHCSAILKTLLQIEIPKEIHEYKHSVNYFNTIKFINFTYSYSCFNINYLFIYYIFICYKL